jgi:hypothetical protein
MILGYDFVEERLFAAPAMAKTLGKSLKSLNGNVPRINIPRAPLASAQNTTNRALGNRLRNAEKAIGGELRRASNLGAKKTPIPPLVREPLTKKWLGFSKRSNSAPY